MKTMNERYFSGRITVRMPIGLHRELDNAAKAQKVSMNQLVCTVLAAELAWTSRVKKGAATGEEEYDEFEISRRLGLLPWED
jgi:HicB-like protein involved in pilus formation